MDPYNFKVFWVTYAKEFQCSITLSHPGSPACLQSGEDKVMQDLVKAMGFCVKASWAWCFVTIELLSWDACTNVESMFTLYTYIQKQVDR